MILSDWLVGLKRLPGFRNRRNNRRSSRRNPHTAPVDTAPAIRKIEALEDRTLLSAMSGIQGVTLESFDDPQTTPSAPAQPEAQFVIAVPAPHTSRTINISQASSFRQSESLNTSLVLPNSQTAVPLAIIQTSSVPESGFSELTAETGALIADINPPDGNDQISEAFALAIGPGGTTTIGFSGKVFMLSITVVANQKVGFDIDTVGSSLNSVIRLFDGSGNELAINDDANNGGPAPEDSGDDSYLEYTFATPGTYFLGVSGFGNSLYDPLTGTGDHASSTGDFAVNFTDLGRPGEARINWVNRDQAWLDQASDNFDSTFGVNADAARSVVDAVIASWERVILDFNQPGGGNEISVSISMSGSGIDFGADASATIINGFPVAGKITIDRGNDTTADGIGDGDGYFLDPTSLDNSEFTAPVSGGAFVGNAEVGSPAFDKFDFFTLVNSEMTHVMRLFFSPARISNPINGNITTTSVVDDSEGGCVGKYRVFDGPSVTHLMTTFDSGGGDTDQLVHSAGAPGGPNQPLDFTSTSRGPLQLFGADGPGNAGYAKSERYLVNDVMALMFQDAYDYSIALPQSFGTTYAMLAQNTGELLIRGGIDGSSDVISVGLNGTDIEVSVNIGKDIAGTGPAGDNSDIAAFVSRFPFADVSSIRIEAGDGADTITLMLDDNLPASIFIDGGPLGDADSATLLGTTGADGITLQTGNTVKRGGTTISLAGMETLLIDVSQNGADIVTVQQGFVGATSSVTVTGGGIDSDTLGVTSSGTDRQAVDITASNITVLEQAVAQLAIVETQSNNALNGLQGVTSSIVSPDGKHVYATGELDDALTVFSRNVVTGALTMLEVFQDKRCDFRRKPGLQFCGHSR